MAKEEKKSVKVKFIEKSGSLDFVLFLAFMGAVVYFVKLSNGFGGFLYALVKAVVWPAIIVYNVLTSMHA